MNIEIRLNITTEDGEVYDETILSLDKPHDQLETIGLTLENSKALLKQLQEKIVDAQAQRYNRKLGTITSPKAVRKRMEV